MNALLLLTGLEPTGNVVGAPARFTVETMGAGAGEVEVVLLNPKGVAEKVTLSLIVLMNTVVITLI